MTIQITLKKIDQEDLELLKNALSHYTGTLQFFTETGNYEESYIKDLSVAVELWHELNKRTIKQFPAEKSTIKLAAHKAFVLRDAVQNFRHGNAPYEKSRCNRFYLAIDEQLPTPKQVISNFNP